MKNATNGHIILEGGANSTNILDFRNMEYSRYGRNVVLKCMFESFKFFSHKNNQKISMDDIYTENNDSRSYYYMGKTKEFDAVECRDEQCLRWIVIDSGGGEEDHYDVVAGCSNVIMSPFTNVYNQFKTYDSFGNTVYVKTNDYTGKNLASQLRNIKKSRVNVIFTEFSLIHDAKFIYKSNDDELIIKLSFGEHNQFNVSLWPYTSEYGHQNFSLFNKHGHYIKPQIGKSEGSHDNEVQTFEQHVNCPAESSINVFANRPNECFYPSNIPDTLDILTLIKFEDVGVYIIGTKKNDILTFSDEIIFAKGNEGSDIYHVFNRYNVTIFNYATDKSIDFIVMPQVPASYSISGKNMLLTISNDTFITVQDFFESSNNQHLGLMDSNQMHSFIPLPHSNKIIPFIRATSSQNVYVLQKLEDHREVVIDAMRSDLKLYYDNGNLLIMRDETNPLVIEIKNYFIDSNVYQNTKWFLYNNNEFESFIIEDANVSDYKYKIKTDYLRVYKEYEIMFDRSECITHNHLKGTDDEAKNEIDRIGLLILNNVHPNTIRIRRTQANLVFFDEVSNNSIEISDWDTRETYRISYIEFSKPFESISINGFDRFNLQQVAEMQNLIDLAAQNMNLQNEFTPLTVIGVKCLITIFGLMENIAMYQCVGVNSIDEHMQFYGMYCNEYQLELFKANSSMTEVKSVLKKLKNDNILNGHDEAVLKFCESNIEIVLQSDYLPKYDEELNARLFMVHNFSVKYIESLLHKGANLNAVSNDSDHQTVLHFAVTMENLDVIKYLVEQKNVNINAVDSRKKTPMHYALLQLLDICEFEELLDPHKMTDYTWELFEIAGYLCSKSAEIKTPLHVSNNEMLIYIIRLLRKTFDCTSLLELNK